MIIFRYVIKEFFKFVTGTVILCVFLFMLFDFIHKATTYFAKYQPSAELIAKFYFFQLPFQLSQIFPIASLLSSVIVMVLLGRNNEITAMRAAGMNPFQIALPLGCGGLILTILSYFLNEVVIPATAQKSHFIAKVLIEGEEVHGINAQAHWIRQKKDIFHFEDYDHSNQILHKIKLLDIKHPFYPSEAIHAKKARYIPDKKKWKLEDVDRIIIDPKGHAHTSEVQDGLVITLPVDPNKLNIDRRLPDEIALDELSERIFNDSKKGIDVLSLRIAWHVKLAFPLAAFLISLLGLKFGYRSERTTETVKSILMAFAIGISYWFILSASRALASAGDIPPLLAGWLANLVILSVVVQQFFKISRT